MFNRSLPCPRRISPSRLSVSSSSCLISSARSWSLSLLLCPPDRPTILPTAVLECQSRKQIDKHLQQPHLTSPHLTELGPPAHPSFSPSLSPSLSPPPSGLFLGTQITSFLSVDLTATATMSLTFDGERPCGWMDGWIMRKISLTSKSRGWNRNWVFLSVCICTANKTCPLVSILKFFKFYVRSFVVELPMLLQHRQCCYSCTFPLFTPLAGSLKVHPLPAAIGSPFRLDPPHSHCIC